MRIGGSGGQVLQHPAAARLAEGRVLEDMQMHEFLQLGYADIQRMILRYAWEAHLLSGPIMEAESEVTHAKKILIVAKYRDKTLVADSAVKYEEALLRRNLLRETKREFERIISHLKDAAKMERVL